MKSVSDLSYGLGVVTTFYTGAYFPLIISSHFQFGRSEPRYLLSFGVQSHHIFSVSAFRVTISSQFRRSEPPSLLNFGIQSHHLLSLGVQSHHIFSFSTFKATISFQFRHSEPPYSQFGRSGLLSLLSLGIQSHYLNRLAFKATISSQSGFQSHHPIMIGHLLPPFWCSELHSWRSRLSFAVQHSKPSSSSICCSKLHISLAFRATVFLQFGVQSHVPNIQSCLSLLVQCSEPHCQHLGLPFSFSLAFRVILTIQGHFHQFQAFKAISSVWHLEPPSSSVWCSELCLHFYIQNHCPTWHLVPPSLFSFGVQSRFFPALSSIVMALGIHIRWHCTSCLHDFYVHPHFPHLVTLCLSLVHYVLLDFSFPCT